MSPQRIQRVIVGGITNCRNRFFFFEPTDFSSNLIESIISEWLVVNPVSCIFHDNPTIVAY